MPRLQAQKITIPLHSIGVDELNPRLPPQQSQREAIRAMVEQQGEKIVHLAADIAEHGLSEAERFMAMVPDNRRFPYISLDGNRRLVALKLLHEPLLAEGVLTNRWLSRLKKLSEEFANDPINEVELAVFDSREHGALWVSRRHSANLNGIGQDAWESIERHRFDAWRGVESREWQVLQFVQEHGNLSVDDQKRLHKLPISTLLRLLSDTYVRQQLGLEYRNNRVVTTLPNEEVIKPLRRILLDLLDKRVDVTMLDGKEDRKRYIDSLAEIDRPNLTATPTHFHRLGQKQRFVEATEAAALAQATRVATTRVTSQKTAIERTNLIPPICQLTITQPRILSIYKELQLIDINTYPTACAMLLRLFVESSLDYYLAQLPIIIPASATVAEKLQAAVSIINFTSPLKDSVCACTHGNLQVDDALLSSIGQSTNYACLQNATPLVADLRQQWGKLQTILHQIWS